MNKKENFIRAVQILAPPDQIMQQAARRVSEEGLPAATVGAALEFVVAMQRMRAPAWPCKTRFRFFRRGSHKSDNARASQSQIGMEDAIRVKSAEFWLKLGQPDQALLEIKSLPEKPQSHPSVKKAHLAVVRAARKSTNAAL